MWITSRAQSQPYQVVDGALVLTAGSSSHPLNRLFLNFEGFKIEKWCRSIAGSLTIGSRDPTTSTTWSLCPHHLEIYQNNMYRH